MACFSVSFEEILAGAAGAVEAEAAQRWLASKKRPYTRPADLVAADPRGLDMRVCHHDHDFHKRRKRTSGAHLLPALQPQHAHTAGAAAGGLGSLPLQVAARLGSQPPGVQCSCLSTMHPAALPCLLLCPAAAKPEPNRAASAADLQQAAQRQAAPRKPASSEALPARRQPAENLYSRAAFVSHGDAIGLAARRKGRPSAGFHLPAGWQPMPPNGAPLLLTKATRSSLRVQLKPPTAAAAGKQKSQQGAGKQQQQQQQQYCSPEGLVLPSLQRVQEVVQGPVVVPARLVQWLKDAAADPRAAQASAGTAAGQAHLLGLCRARVVLVEEERRRMGKRLDLAAAAAAAAAAGGGSQNQPGRQRRQGLRG